MTSDELVGAVAARYLHDRLMEEDTEGVARYLLDCLTPNQTASVARAILGYPSLADLVEIKLPSHFVEGLGLPDEVLTTERATYFRNADCGKAALLLANTGDDEEQSLKDLVPIGGPQLQAHLELWIAAGSAGLPLTDEHKYWWLKALDGLQQVRSFALDRFAEYVAETRDEVSDGRPVLLALGYALPSLHLPRDTSFFHNSLNEKTARHPSKWRTLFTTIVRRRGCYLTKQTPTQAILLSEDLERAFERVRDSIPDVNHEAVKNFIAASSGWNASAAALGECEWEEIKPLFDGLKRERFNLGKATLDFYDEREPDLLTDDERDYLQRLAKTKRRSEPEDEDAQFYRDHRFELREEPHLKSRWDKLVFGAPIESEDFLLGIALCLEWLIGENAVAGSRRLTITSDRRTKRDLRDLNVDAGLYFAMRYRGLPKLLGRQVTLDLGEIWKFAALDSKWRNQQKPYVNRSGAKSALQIKFTLDLESEGATGDLSRVSKQLVWKYRPKSIASEFPGDIARLAEHPFMSNHVHRESVSPKGRSQSIELQDVSSFYPAYGQDKGSLVATYKVKDDMSRVWRANLADSIKNGLVSEEGGAKLSREFDTFERHYRAALQGFLQDGLACEDLTEQSRAYGSLLEAICTDARGDRNREAILRPLLQLGVVVVLGGATAAIAAPWQPLRLAGMGHKARQVAGLVRYLLTAEVVHFGDAALFFKEQKSELQHPFYPEVVVGWVGAQSELLAETDHHLDYSLHESATVSNQGLDDTNENPNDTAGLVVDLARRYLTLYPHERANLSVVLYNCDSARLPYAVVNNMSQLHEDEEDMRCEIILRHRNNTRLQDLYEKIVESADSDVDSFVSSEASKDFMARLRIGIMADQAPAPNPKDGPPADIVFLQDVIARHATIEWYPEDGRPVDPATLIPARWSRRRASAIDDLKSVVYLCCPVQSSEGWAFITSIMTLMKGDWDGNRATRWLPARRLDYNEVATGSIFNEIHNLGNWVVNFDELLDRRQLLNQNVRVIRYKQSATQGRNLLISSTASLTLLRTMVLSRLRDLNLQLRDDEYSGLTEKFIDDANDVSGDIVLRAARRGRYASELIGLVLSRHLIRHEFRLDSRFGWYFLDDYADWLGQTEGRVADILVMVPEETKDGLQLGVIISEAKYIDAANLASKRRESQKQLRDTIRRIDDAVFGDPRRLDRDLWLSRFSDLLLSGVQFPTTSPIDVAAWRRAVREGICGIHLRGYSHVFVSGPSESPECSEIAIVPDAGNSYQEVYSRARVRELVLSYWQNSDPTVIRRAVSDLDLWSERSYRTPSSRAEVLRVTKEEQEADHFAPREATASSKSSTSAGPAPPVVEKHDSGDTGDGTTSNGGSEAADVPTWPHHGIEDLLSEFHGGEGDGSEDVRWLKDVGNRCKAALQQFQLQAKLLESVLTPNAALLKFQGSAHLTVEQVLRKRSEFLTTHKLNVITVRAEPGVVAIAIARPERRILHLPDVWNTWRPKCEQGNHELLIGLKEDDSSHLYLSPSANAPHSLIAGSTGSGKSVLMQNIILAIASTNTPEFAQIVLIDPKLGVDYFAFERLPHLRRGIIDNDQDAIEELSGLVEEMDRRYRILRENRVANVFELNKKTDATERLPILWIVHDEFAEWMMTEEYSGHVASVVGRLGVKARAAGISLIFAAQRPDANVMPMQLRANLGNRLVLRVDSEGTSEIALGQKGAERLLGKGHLAARLEGEPDVIFAQVPFVSNDFIAQIVAHLARTST